MNRPRPVSQPIKRTDLPKEVAILLRMRKSDAYICESLQSDGFAEQTVLEEIARQRQAQQGRFNDILRPLFVAAAIGVLITVAAISSGMVNRFGCWFFGVLAMAVVLLGWGVSMMMRALSTHGRLTAFISFFRLRSLINAYADLDDEDKETCSTGMILQGLGILVLFCGSLLIVQIIGPPK
jgi:hypothetical protein